MFSTGADDQTRPGIFQRVDVRLIEHEAHVGRDDPRARGVDFQDRITRLDLLQADGNLHVSFRFREVEG